MTKQNVVVVPHYEPEKLPPEIVGSIPRERRVTVAMEDGKGEPRFMKFRGMAADRKTSIEEAVARIRALRDDRD